MPRGSTYADNAYNRSIGRAGAPMGTMPVSRSSAGSGSCSSSGSTYVDNSYNRQAGRVGMPKGSMPISRSSSAGASASGSSRSGSHIVNDNNSKPISESGTTSSSEVKVYKDNAMNRRLGRVGLPLGAAPHSSKSGTSASKRFYVDNAMNRQLDRVGKEVGTMPVSKTKSRNSRKSTQPTHVMNKMLDALLQQSDADIMGDLPTDVPSQEQEYMCDAVLGLIRRMDQVLEWQATNTTPSKEPKTSLSEFKYQGPVIKFDEIELGAKIGHGGFGDVYFAKWQGLVCAVKKLRVQRVSKRRLRQFQEEVEVLCCLDHPRIVKFLGACIVTPKLAIVMEYMKKSLYEALHVEEVEFSDKEQYQIILHMAEGLAYLHTKSVAHCDIKSTNILLTDSDDGVVAKISDFGLSMMKSEAETSQSTAKVVQGLGTPKYSAPEVLLGDELNLEAMCKADIYSMGVVAWEVLCQEVPFFGLNIHQLKRRVLIGDVNLKIPEDIKLGEDILVLLKECWRQDANKRPSSQAFNNRLEKLNGIK